MKPVRLSIYCHVSKERSINKWIKAFSVLPNISFPKGLPSLNESQIFGSSRAFRTNYYWHSLWGNCASICVCSEEFCFSFVKKHESKKIIFKSIPDCVYKFFISLVKHESFRWQKKNKLRVESSIIERFKTFIGNLQGWRELEKIHLVFKKYVKDFEHLITLRRLILLYPCSSVFVSSLFIRFCHTWGAFRKHSKAINLLCFPPFCFLFLACFPFLAANRSISEREVETEKGNC